MATIRSISSVVSSTSGSISGVISVAPGGMRLGGGVTRSMPADPASAATVGVSNNVRTDTETPRPRSSSTRRTASSEWPPSSKKSSSTPTAGSPSTSANAAHSASSRGLDGPRPAPVAAAWSGAGRAWRSSLPLAVSGSDSSTTQADGTMWSGSRSAAKARTTDGSSPAPS